MVQGGGLIPTTEGRSVARRTPQPDRTSDQAARTRALVLGGVAVLVAIVAGALLLSEGDDDDEYDRDDLASWCSVASGRDFEDLVATRLADPRVGDVEVAGSTLPGPVATEMLLATLASIREDPPPEVAADVERAVEPLQQAIGDGRPASPEVTGEALSAAGRLQDYVDANC